MNMNSTHNHSILLVEDDEKLSGLIAKFLEKNGLQVETEFRGDTAVSKILQLSPDLVVLDVMLPGLDGFEVCKQVRQTYKGAILMLTAKDDDIDQIVGLEIGADDYVVKPVEPRLLLARIRALLRRSPQSLDGQLEQPTQPKLNFDSLKIDHSARTVSLNEQAVDLTSTEFNLLWLLASHAGEALSRELICESIFHVEYNGLNRSVDNKISRLRKVLSDDPNKPRRIKTIRGKGYLFVASAW
jgi:DNA-binding response OmpR family regulator